MKDLLSYKTKLVHLFLSQYKEQKAFPWQHIHHHTTAIKIHLHCPITKWKHSEKIIFKSSTMNTCILSSNQPLFQFSCACFSSTLQQKQTTTKTNTQTIHIHITYRISSQPSPSHNQPLPMIGLRPLYNRTIALPEPCNPE